MSVTSVRRLECCCFFFNDPATTEIYTLSLHDALPIWLGQRLGHGVDREVARGQIALEVSALKRHRSEEHTSELQSLAYLVCRLLLEKKKIKLHHPTPPAAKTLIISPAIPCHVSPLISY